MDRKSMKTLAPARLSDDALATASGAKGIWYGPVANVQTNVSGPIIQVAALNGGPVTQVAGVLQGNSFSL